MKKISLKNLNLKEVDKLSREQLKNVLGGYTSGTGITGEGTTTSPTYFPNCSGMDEETCNAGTACSDSGTCGWSNDSCKCSD